MNTTFSMLNRDPVTAQRTREILGLPEDLDWSDLQVEFGLDNVGSVTLKLIPTGEQVAQLAALAVHPLPSSCAPETEEPSDDRPHSRACGYRRHPHGPLCAVDCPTCHT